MSNWFCIPLALLLLADADIPRLHSFRASEKPVLDFPSDDDIPLFPSAGKDSDGSQPQAKPASAAKSGPLQESSKLILIRFVSGEFAKALKALPAGKDGFNFPVGKPLNAELLDRAVASHGAAVNSGDSVQITRLEFRGSQIIVDLNGGGRGKRHWRDHLQIGIGGGYPTVQSTSTQDTGPPGLQPGMGSTLFLDWNKSVPDLTPDDLKQVLSPFLNFQKERSASLQWIDTLPPEMKKAIQDRRPMVGMDHEEVVAAIGKPDHKVRERDSEGNDIEDWIYGQPPSKTIFVRFIGDKVTSIKQFPQ
jgi:hypothetical protein